MSAGYGDIYDPSGQGSPMQSIPLDWSWLMGLTGGLYDPQFDPNSPTFIGSAGGVLENPYGGYTTPGPTTPPMAPPILQPPPMTPPPMAPLPPPSFGQPGFVPGGGISGSGGGTGRQGGFGGGGGYGSAATGGGAYGGAVGPEGEPKGMARGGYVPGRPDNLTDNRPIRADEGEFVLSRQAASLLGPDVLGALNDPVLAPRLGMAIQKVLKDIARQTGKAKKR